MIHLTSTRRSTGHLRKLASRAFTTRRVSMIEARIRGSSAPGCSTPKSGPAGFDYVQDFSEELPPLVISSLLGVPEGEQEELRRHRRRRLPHRGGRGAWRMRCSFKGIVTLGQRTSASSSGAPHHPRDDVFTDLVAAPRSSTSDGTAGCHDGELTEFGIRDVQCRHRDRGPPPRLVRRASSTRTPSSGQSSPPTSGLVPNAVEESLRYEPPSPVNARFTTRDVTLHDVTIPAKTKVVLVTGSGGPGRAQVSRPRRARRPPRGRPALDLG